ncbi:MAG: hypothetical protein IJK89_03865 [Clostridia bacterium]|nr:hypothetical protein [Clostridia bacterium]
MAVNKPMMIGYHTDIYKSFSNNPKFDLMAKTGKGVDFVLCHVDTRDGTYQDNLDHAEMAAKAFKELGVPFIASYEGQNFNLEQKTTDGHDWVHRGDGTHLLRLPADYFKKLNSEGNCMGFMYDELEHVIINRNISLSLATKFKEDRPAFPTYAGKDPLKQGALLDSQLHDYAAQMKANGAKTVSGEHVFPVLFHLFARNGIIPNFKSQKESFSNVQFAIAAGAAKQYGVPLWNCVDLWCRMTYPGHSAQEMYNNLVFAYLMGVDLVYVESADAFMDNEGNLTEYGETFRKFCDEYKGKERAYNHMDYRPEIGIVRYDDTYWGQGRVRWMWRNMLFGNPAIKSDDKCKEWIKVFDMLTHGETGGGGISWGRVELRSLTRHRSFASMNNLAVFDDQAKKSDLETLKLCFLCGYQISDETLAAVAELVRDNGLTVVTTERFAPKGHIIQKGYPFTEIADGKGTWIVTKRFDDKALKKRLAGFLGNKGEMRYVFGGEEIRLRIDEDGDGFTRL